MSHFSLLRQEIVSLKNPIKAKILAHFFKTQPSQYGENDRFLGIIVPEQKKLIKTYYQKVNLTDLTQLTNHKYHEFRLIGYSILVEKYQLYSSKPLINSASMIFFKAN